MMDGPNPSAGETPEGQPHTGPFGFLRHLHASHAFAVVKRIAVGCYEDGLIHAGNLAYMSLLAIFPFFVTGAAAVSLLGEEGDRAAAVRALLSAMLPSIFTSSLLTIAFFVFLS